MITLARVDVPVRYIVVSIPSRPPHVRQTRPDDILAARTSFDCEGLCYALKAIEVWWHKVQQRESVGGTRRAASRLAALSGPSSMVRGPLTSTCRSTSRTPRPLLPKEETSVPGSVSISVSASGGELPARCRCWRGGTGRSSLGEVWPKADGQVSGARWAGADGSHRPDAAFPSPAITSRFPRSQTIGTAGRPSGCITVEHKVASADGRVAGEAGALLRLGVKFAIVKLKEAPASGRGDVF